MLPQPQRVRRDPHNDFFHHGDDPIRLDEARLDAWALALGQRRGGARPGWPAYRWLPDPDFSRPISSAHRLDRISGLISRLLRRAEPAGASETAAGAVADDAAALGESRLKAYVRLIETEASAKAAPSAPAGNRKQSHAA